MSIDEAFIDAVIAELRNAAEFLLEGDSGGSPRSLEPLRTVGGALEAADYVTGCVPALLERAPRRQSRASIASFEVHRTRRSARGRVPRAASGWSRTGTQSIAPKYLEESVPRLSADRESLRWLVWVLDLVDDAVREFAVRVSNRHEELLSIGGTSHWEELELERFDGLVLRFDMARLQLERARARIRASFPGVLRPSSRPPRPFPVDPNWRALGVRVTHWQQPERQIGGWLKRLIEQPIEQAELPFLYERWCGLQLVESLVSFGFEVEERESVVWRMFLGGEIGFQRGGHGLALWIEPIIGEGFHRCGLAVNGGGTRSPDFVLVDARAGGSRWATLDATLSTNAAALTQKGRYRRDLMARERIVVAGVSTLVRPEAAWAICPSPGPNQLFDLDGSLGAVSLRPGPNCGARLDEWVGWWLRR